MRNKEKFIQWIMRLLKYKYPVCPEGWKQQRIIEQTRKIKKAEFSTEIIDGLKIEVTKNYIGYRIGEKLNEIGAIEFDTNKYDAVNYLHGKLYFIEPFNHE